ncbi:hypothetical protein EVAR_97662_1 [Eumeta japonica]|uniref:Uncharacterized protein n=1 Tax=Eumeta variegata TaxID=151549 RepID=A0A4C1X0Q4_EUMVA|nr:hypothetical protein EVAR_97662_1 [Eumeta japonica]
MLMLFRFRSPGAGYGPCLRGDYIFDNVALKAGEDKGKALRNVADVAQTNRISIRIGIEVYHAPESDSKRILYSTLKKTHRRKSEKQLRRAARAHRRGRREKSRRRIVLRGMNRTLWIPLGNFLSEEATIFNGRVRECPSGVSLPSDTHVLNHSV